MAIRVLVADDHQVVRSGLASLFEDADIEIVDEASTGDEVAKGYEKHKPDVLLLDIRLGGSDGLEVFANIRQRWPEARAIIFSTYDNPTYVARAIALGASDYVLKSGPRERLISAITRTAAGETAPEASLLEQVREIMKRSGDDSPEGFPLTNREMQVLRHLALGLSNKEIGRSLEISVETVKEHVQNVLRKMEAVDRTQAAVRAVKQGLV